MSRGESHTLLFSPYLVRYFQGKATQALLLSKYGGGQWSGISGCSDSTRKESFAFGQLWNEIWVLWKEKTAICLWPVSGNMLWLLPVPYRQRSGTWQSGYDAEFHHYGTETAKPAKFLPGGTWFRSPLSTIHQWKRASRSGLQAGRPHKDQLPGSCLKDFEPCN